MVIDDYGKKIIDKPSKTQKNTSGNAIEVVIMLFIIYLVFDIILIEIFFSRRSILNDKNLSLFYNFSFPKN